MFQLLPISTEHLIVRWTAEHRGVKFSYERNSDVRQLQLRFRGIIDLRSFLQYFQRLVMHGTEYIEIKKHGAETDFGNIG